ncbi:MAG TPA: hypothetical protein VMF13_16870, partial [Luteitalea sp.]|nr:hypothetical protein [Luteitalea sp.]
MRGRSIAAVLSGAVVVAASMLAVRAQAPVSTTPADLVVLGGRVLTLDPSSRVVQAVAIRDGKVVAVGADTAVRPLVGAKTR